MKKAPLIQDKREIKTRNFKNINTDQFKIDLKNKLDNIQRDINIDEMYGNYVDTITSHSRQTCPYIKKEMY